MPNEVDGRTRLIRAAARLFLGRSYGSVGINEICTAARTNKGGFYHHFDSKSALAMAVVDHHAQALWALMDAAEKRRRGPVNRLRSCCDVVGGIQSELHGFFGRVVGCPLGNLAVELATTEAQAAAHVASVLQRWELRLAEHGHAAAQQGRLRPDTHPDELAHRTMAAMQGAILLAKAYDEPPETIPLAMRRTIEACLA